MRPETTPLSADADLRLARRMLPIGILLAALAAWPAPGTAGELTVRECAEGSDFIRNAAHARDNGMPKAHFLSKIRDDLEMIKAFPPELRWFVQDDDDAAFLLQAATEVFQRPRAPQSHQADFFKACLAKTKPADRELSRL